MEQVSEKDVSKVKASKAATNINWCSGANDWDDAENGCYTGALDADNCNEQNGNVIKNDNNR